MPCTRRSGRIARQRCCDSKARDRKKHRRCLKSPPARALITAAAAAGAAAGFDVAPPPAETEAALRDAPWRGDERVRCFEFAEGAALDSSAPLAAALGEAADRSAGGSRGGLAPPLRGTHLAPVFLRLRGDALADAVADASLGPLLPPADPAGALSPELIAAYLPLPLDTAYELYAHLSGVSVAEAQTKLKDALKLAKTNAHAELKVAVRLKRDEAKSARRELKLAAKAAAADKKRLLQQSNTEGPLAGASIEEGGAGLGERSRENAGREGFGRGPEVGLARCAMRSGSRRADIRGRTAGCSIF